MEDTDRQGYFDLAPFSPNEIRSLIFQNFAPVPLSKSQYGKFHSGDSYIVLKTTLNTKLSWDIHFWLGSETSQDEAGTAALMAVNLDDKLNGAAVQHREVQGYESSQFLAYFQPAIRYLEGGHASGFSHVTTNAGVQKKFFHIKGKRNVRVRQVEPAVASMNQGDCFVLSAGKEIYVFVGQLAKHVERLKAVSVANQIRDQDHNGRGTLQILDQYSSEVELDEFFGALGSGNKDEVPAAEAGGDDEYFEKVDMDSVSLYEISDSSGAMKCLEMKKPLLKELLKSTECYILDAKSAGIYVWVGRDSNKMEKTEAMTTAEAFIKQNRYPNWVHITRVPQGTEPPSFKNFFTGWH